MSAPDRSWTIAPTLMWFGAWTIAALFVIDGGLQAVADRVTARREPPAAGPAFSPKPILAAASTDDDKPVVLPRDTGDRSRVGALEDVCLDGTPEHCKRWAMDGYFKAVAASKGGTLGRAVRVSWYGDSVIATDAIPARLRARLQAELGDGGPGFVYIVPPHRFCAHEGVHRATTDDWVAHAISSGPAADGIYGVGGSTAETIGGQATIKLVGGTVTNVELYWLGQPRGGRATLRADGTEVLVADTRADTKQGGHTTATIAGGAKKFEIDVHGKVRLGGIDLENATGAVVDNFGIVSVHAKNFVARDLADFAREVAHREADLVMIMIGANEAQWLSVTGASRDYQANFARAIAPLRAARPDATCLVLSPLDQAEAKDGAYPSRPVMGPLVDAQRRAARAAGCAFFSTYDWMGGKGSASKWFYKGLVGTDFQHLSRRGANKLADAVFETLTTGYQRYAKP